MSTASGQIRHPPAYRTVAETLRERILDRSLRDGDRLPGELELARQFGVNRSTIREALRDLQTSGLVVRRKGSKRFAITRPAPSFVAEGVSRALTLHEVTYFDLWESLTILEPPIAEAAARRLTAATLPPILAAADGFTADQADTSRAVHHVAGFFRAVGTAADNPVLMLAQEPLLALLEPSLASMIDRVPQARARIRVAQRKLCAALAARDAVEARAWMARHIRDFRRGYELAGIALELPCIATSEGKP